MKAIVLFLCLLAAGIAPRLEASPVISEILASNSRTLADEDGDFPDWIEIHNPDSAPVSLDGYYLTDDSAFLAKWRFPDVSIAAKGYLLVFASGKDRTNTASRLHTNFQLDNDGEFLALVSPDTNVVSGFIPAYPAQKDDVAFGLAQKIVTSSLLANSAAQVLVPAGAAELPADWQLAGFSPGPEWLTAAAPPAVGFDTNQAAPPPVNVARQGAAIQSTTSGANAANFAINGILTDFSQTLSTDADPFWQVSLTNETAVQRIVLRNRTSCCGSRLRDITVQVLATNATGEVTNFTSALLNPENAGFTYPAGPAFLELNLVALTGNPVFGHIVRVHRTADPDLSGSGGQGGTEEANALALGEVEVLGAPVALNEVNLGRTGSPLPSARQSSTNGSFFASLALNGNLGDFTHTLGTDSNAAWIVNLGRNAMINSVTLHNRQSCCQSRLRDITVEVLAADGATPVYTSPLLNPENVLGNPASLNVDLSGAPAFGQYVRVRRTADPDLSGSGGQGNADEASVLSLAEVVILGVEIGGYRPFIRTDLQSRMLNVNASAFARIPFAVSDPASIQALTLRLRYDDGFAASLNGTSIAARNAPGSLAWNSAATASRTLSEGAVAEIIDLTPHLASLTLGANLLTVQGLNSAPADGDFLFQPELLATSVLVTSNVFLTDATPEAQNDSDFYLDEVADTTFSVNRGFFEAPFELEISTPTDGAAIYYSFDSSEPRPGQGILYTGPVTISNTTVLRARAFKAGWKATDVDTHTYIFLADVLYQGTNWPASPPQYFPASWGANAVNYGMDPQIVTQYTTAQWKEAFTQIPTMSVVTEMKNLFDSATGIYANASGHGEIWERPSSLELLDPTNVVHGRFQENCGLRIRGGFSRNPQFVKHSFRVFFRREYGAGRLNYPLFENEGAQEFDKFDLRTAQNYSWPRETSYDQGRHDTMVREVFCRETLGAMGQPYRRSRYYHLYVNGHYWGLYETDERPEAAYGETYFGGDQDDYDVVKCGNRGTSPNFITEATDGNLLAFSNLWTMTRSMVTNSANSNYFRILGRNPDGSRHPALPVMLDVDNLIDYMLGIFYSGDGDATLSSFLSNNQPNNWFGMRNRNNPEMGFRFFNSDCEHTLGSPNSQVDRTGPFPHANQALFQWANPQWMHEELSFNPEYRLLFADHVHKHFFNGGALTFQAVTNRFLGKASQIEKAVRAYSARWGDAVREPPYNENDWKAEISWIITNWFPPRAALVLQQLRQDGLVSSNGPPVFSQHGGEITNEFPLTITHTNATGAIYYTLDGSDPRLVGGAISPSAIAYSGPVVLIDNARVKARVLVGSAWSALTSADFAVPDLQPLRITEMMYNPAPVTEAEMAAGFFDNNDFEYMELRNVGTRPMHLAGISFAAGISFTFSSGSLAAGERLVLVRSVEAFTNRYGSTANIAGVYGGRLDNAGERLRLQDSFGRAIHDFSYSDGWYPTTDGFGFSLVIVDDTQPVGTWGNKASWRPSSTLGGSPGRANPVAPLFPFVVINEVLTRPAPGGQVTVELANLGDAPADITDWWLTDAFRIPKKFRLPQTILPPGGFVTFTEAQFNQGSNAFTFLGNAGEIRLFSGDATGELTGYFQGWDFAASDEGVSFGRHVISTGADHLPAQVTASFPGANAGPRVGPVVITEIMYRPPDDGILDNSVDEYVELQNISGAPVPLYEPASPTNTWSLTGGIDMGFPTNVILAAGEYVLLVNFNPLDTVAAQRFRALYSVPVEVRLIGPYSGKLDNSGEDIEIKKPTLFPTGFPGTVLVDKVSYRDSAPWDAAADGYGLSLHRINTGAYGNEPLNWRAAPATAAAAVPGGGTGPSISTQPEGLVARTGASVALRVTVTGDGPLRFQWRANGVNVPHGTNATLELHNAQPADSGDYVVLVYNGAGSVLSEPAAVVIAAPPQLSGPVDAFIPPGSNAVFTVQAASARPLTYQWQFNGQDIPDAGGPTLVINNAQVSQDGIYTVVVRDDINLPVTASARLYVLVQPLIIQQPLSQPVVQGGNVTLSVVVSNTATFPITYRWRRGTAFVQTNVANSNVDFMLVTNVQPGSSAILFVVISNPARSNALLSSTANLQVLADFDADGLPDAWEVASGFDTNTTNDAGGDRDNDTLSNWEEYIAGTDPTNALSFLEIDGPAQEPGGARLEFLAVSNRTYTVGYRTAVDSPVLLKLRDFPARPTNRVEVLYDTSAASPRYYQLITPRQP